MQGAQAVVVWEPVRGDGTVSWRGTRAMVTGIGVGSGKYVATQSSEADSTKLKIWRLDPKGTTATSRPGETTSGAVSPTVETTVASTRPSGTSVEVHATRVVSCVDTTSGVPTPPL